MERIAAVVVGAGQAGLSVSHELTERGIEHVILERGTLGHTWRTKRWRSFHLGSPNSLNLLPGYEYDGPEPDAFLDTAGILDYLEGYAGTFAAPIRTGTPVRDVRPADDGGYVVRTPSAELWADQVIVATGAFGRVFVPTMAANLPATIRSIHTDEYWAPEDLPPALCWSWARASRASRSRASWRRRAGASSPRSAGMDGFRGGSTVATR